MPLRTAGVDSVDHGRHDFVVLPAQRSMVELADFRCVLLREGAPPREVGGVFEELFYVDGYFPRLPRMHGEALEVTV